MEANHARVKAEKPSLRHWCLRGITVGEGCVALARERHKWIDAVKAATAKKTSEGGLSDRAFYVGSVLAREFINQKTGVAWPKRETLAEKCGRSLDTVDRALKELETKGYLAALRIKAAGTGKVYGLRLPDVDALWLSYDEDVRTHTPQADGPNLRTQTPQMCGLTLRTSAESHKNQFKGTGGSEPRGREGVGLRPEDSPSHPLYSTSPREGSWCDVIDLEARRQSDATNRHHGNVPPLPTGSWRPSTHPKLKAHPQQHITVTAGATTREILEELMPDAFARARLAASTGIERVAKDLPSRLSSLPPELVDVLVKRLEMRALTFGDLYGAVSSVVDAEVARLKNAQDHPPRIAPRRDTAGPW